jgi:hypothetical protein
LREVDFASGRIEVEILLMLWVKRSSDANGTGKEERRKTRRRVGFKRWERNSNRVWAGADSS